MIDEAEDKEGDLFTDIIKEEEDIIGEEGATTEEELSTFEEEDVPTEEVDLQRISSNYRPRRSNAKTNTGYLKVKIRGKFYKVDGLHT